ncbi:MAG: 1-acyl-sn-glycerol-3-phosphate acyltransferase [Polyangiaceae bacterium]|nr:1-acyl-sn-glycerol-3-phosphate acyltransferase [Polyangiaceae bacterium]
MAANSPPEAPPPELGGGDACQLSPLGLAAFNAAFWPYLVGTSALAFFPMVGCFALSVFDKERTILRRFTEEWGAHYLERAPGAGVTVVGRERAPIGQPAIYVSNHESMVDILAIFSARLPALWVSKVENFYTPVLGWNMYLNGYISLKRGYLPSIMKMVRNCIKTLDSGRSLIVFPEGTRSEDGNLRPFYRGAFMLAARAKVPVVPIILDGTRNVLRKRSMTVRPQHVTLKVLDPIDPKVVDYDSHRLRDLTRSVMADELAALRGGRTAGALRPASTAPAAP